jgi:hypothetical protein
MARRGVMSEKPIVTAKEIARFLEQTGFVFEMRMHDVFRKNGYTCEIGGSFLDLEGDVEREIDLICSKVINDVNAHFVIECKQSQLDKWIFICTKGNADRFYYGVKHLPNVSVETLKSKDLFSHFHHFDRDVPLAHNYICYSAATGKKSDHRQIDECVHKLPKALSDLASRVEAGKHVFFPVGLFSGQIFEASFKGVLVVEERPFLQYYYKFVIPSYFHDPERRFASSHSMGIFPLLAELEATMKTNREQRIREASRNVGSPYPIDFVSEKGLPEFIARVEKDLSHIRNENWLLASSGEASQNQS